MKSADWMSARVSFQLTQKIARADEPHALINHRAPLLNIGVLEKQKRLGRRAAAQEAFQRFDGGLFAEPRYERPFFEAPSAGSMRCPSERCEFVLVEHAR